MDKEVINRRDALKRIGRIGAEAAAIVAGPTLTYMGYRLVRGSMTAKEGNLPRIAKDLQKFEGMKPSEYGLAYDTRFEPGRAYFEVNKTENMGQASLRLLFITDRDLTQQDQFRKTAYTRTDSGRFYTPSSFSVNDYDVRIKRAKDIAFTEPINPIYHNKAVVEFTMQHNTENINDLLKGGDLLVSHSFLPSINFNPTGSERLENSVPSEVLRFLPMNETRK